MKWHYPDSAGVWHVGEVEKTVDLGGTDVSYFFRGDDGSFTVRRLSASDCKAAHPDYGRKVKACGICGR